MYIAKRDEICRRRVEIGMNQKQLSLKAGLPGNAIYRIEIGESAYTYPIRARAIAKALGCKVTEIFIEAKGAVKKVG